MYSVLIAHRGNINGVFPEVENTPQYIQHAIGLGYDVEIDVRWVDGKFFLGHDVPHDEMSLDWLLARKDRLWVHAKNFEALSRLLDTELKVFYHQLEAHTIIGNSGFIWSHNLPEANYKSVIPLLSLKEAKSYTGQDVHGICSDFVQTFTLMESK